MIIEGRGVRITVKELIIELLTCPMNANVELEVLTDNHRHKYSEADLGSVVHYREYGVVLKGDQMAKVILVDNLNRESVADILLEDNIDTQSAKLKAEEYNDTHCHSDYGWFARAVEDDYQLWRGIEELI